MGEALRRRKAEKLTQREHAALAGVSIPTIVAFDKGEYTLSLSKAFAILRVVGLVEERLDEGAQEVFVRQGVERWRELTAKLPEQSPARFPRGWYRIDYALEGKLRQPKLPELQKILEKSAVRHTGWPMFVSLTRPDVSPREVDGVIECWIRPPERKEERALVDPAHCDYWRAAPSGRLMLMRGYQEDSQETVPPGTIFDTTLPIWRLGEALLHAAHMAEQLRADEQSEITVKFRALYTGLTGRVLRSLQGQRDLLESMAARSDEALLETVLSAHTIQNALADAVYPLVAALYERFGVPKLAPEFVQTEIGRFQAGRF